MDNDNYHLSQNILSNAIRDNIINPAMVKEIEDLCKSREKWRKVSNYSEAIGNFLVLAAAIVSFASGIYEENIVSFIGGCLATSAISLVKFSIYANNECIERNKSLNKLLKYFNVNPMPNPIISNQIVQEENTRNIINNSPNNTNELEYY